VTSQSAAQLGDVRRLEAVLKRKGEDIMGVGFAEVLWLVPFFLVSLVIPIVILILVFLTYRKVGQIQKRLGG
jgi:hypothetical protein